MSRSNTISQAVSNTGNAYATSKEFRNRFAGIGIAANRYVRSQAEIDRIRAHRVWLKVKDGTITGTSLEGVQKDYKKWFAKFEKEAQKFTAKLKG